MSIDKSIEALEMFGDPFKGKVQKQNDPFKYVHLTTMTSTRIYIEGLLKTLERYRDRCMHELRDKIECIIEEVNCMNPGERPKLFTFAYSQMGSIKLDYIGLTVKKLSGISTTDRVVCDYTIYKYSYVEPKDQVDPYKQYLRYWMFFLPENVLPYVEFVLLFGHCIWSHLQNEKQKTKKPSLDDRISALKSCFMAELAKRNIVDDYNELLE